MTKRLIPFFILICLLASCAPAKVSPTQTPHFTPAANPTTTNFSVTQIRIPGDPDGRQVLTAFWSENGRAIYYALVNEIPDTPLWFEISLESGQNFQNTQLSSPPRLIYNPFLPIGGVYLEYQGLISPSERYRFQITKSDNYSLHILDSIEQSEIELLTNSDMNFRGAYWIPGENSVVFGVGPEYGTFFYLYDIRERKLTAFEELLGYTDPNISEWALSPDGKHIAILDENLKVFSLDGIFAATVSGYLSNVRWAGNSQRIYYYYGDQLYSPTSLGYFDLSTETVTELAQLSELENLGIDIGLFDVSADGNHLVFWQAGDIWLLSLFE